MNIEKFKSLERVKISYLKHRGNALKVVEETGYPAEYVRKCIGKIKKKEEKNVSVLISHTLIQHIMEGHNSRLRYLIDMINSLENREQLNVSMCCRMPYRVVDGNNVCIKCNNVCEVMTTDRINIYEVKQNIIDGMREEDKCLVDFAVKMGYVGSSQPPAPIIRQNTLVVQNNSNNLSDGQKEVVKNFTNLTPLEREKLRLSLEKQIMNEYHVDKIEDVPGV